MKFRAKRSKNPEKLLDINGLKWYYLYCDVLNVLLKCGGVA